MTDDENKGFVGRPIPKGKRFRLSDIVPSSFEEGGFAPPREVESFSSWLQAAPEADIASRIADGIAELESRGLNVTILPVHDLPPSQSKQIKVCITRTETRRIERD